MRCDESLKLVPDLIPATSFFKNLRALLRGREWDRVRKAVYKKAGYKCEACGLSHGVLHCHEVWEYEEETGVQKLVGLVALCVDCHEVKHIGLAQMRGRIMQAMEHMKKVNGVSDEVVGEVVQEAFGIWKRRSRRAWTLDLSAWEEIRAGQ
jgi:hypothetical protein